ncbi:hypothetical protein M0208_03955 [Sphingomonas sp. SUN019]|uniref:hypothetical protein n=1 Tax=Sphingomonas sp. SUN019 TaxID=2937788 RepID=UPI002164BD37|nr:hypothetical protein [Sphingomonas sp. SUN019]UVO49705.1 hypothetical protein M0208_03955 [Sphingomonas sp. SUN019]
MKAFHCLVGLRQPLTRVAPAIRDRLPEIAPALDDVEIIRAVARVEQPCGGVKLVNEWRVNPKLPAALNGHITPDMLGWLDHADWSADLTHCRWRIEPYFMAEAISCEGETRFEPAMGGRGTRATFEGRLDIDASALMRVPAAWRRPAAAAIELLIGTLIPKNFRNTADAAAGLLD